MFTWWQVMNGRCGEWRWILKGGSGLVHQIKATRSWQVQYGRELLAIREMIARGSSQTLADILPNRLVCSAFVRRELLSGKKVDSIVRKNEAVPDMDCADDPESARFWRFTDARSMEADKLTVTGTATTTVKSNAESVSTWTLQLSRVSLQLGRSPRDGHRNALCGAEP